MGEYNMVLNVRFLIWKFLHNVGNVEMNYYNKIILKIVIIIIIIWIISFS